MRRPKARIPARLAGLLKQARWPRFTEEQVAFLEDLFPERCLQVAEPVEVHLRYAGAVELIGLMRANVAAEAYTGEGVEALADHEETWEQAREAVTKTTEVQLDAK